MKGDSQGDGEVADRQHADDLEDVIDDAQLAQELGIQVKVQPVGPVHDSQVPAETLEPEVQPAETLEPEVQPDETAPELQTLQYIPETIPETQLDPETLPEETQITETELESTPPSKVSEAMGFEETEKVSPEVSLEDVSARIAKLKYPGCTVLRFVECSFRCFL